MITFNKVDIQGKEFEYMQDAMGKGVLSGDGKYSKKCSSFFTTELRMEIDLFVIFGQYVRKDATVPQPSF